MFEPQNWYMFIMFFIKIGKESRESLISGYIHLFHSSALTACPVQQAIGCVLVLVGCSRTVTPLYVTISVHFIIRGPQHLKLDSSDDLWV